MSVPPAVKPSDVGCLTCNQPSIVLVNGKGGCLTHLDDVMQPLEEGLRAVLEFAAYGFGTTIDVDGRTQGSLTVELKGRD